MAQKDNILQELTELGSRLAAVEPRNPYVVPPRYFEDLLPALMEKIHAMDSDNASDEIRAISPLLAGMKKEMPFAVPDGYFAELSLPRSKEAKIVSLDPRKWLRYAAAVVITGFLVLGGLLFLRNNDVETMPIVRFEKKLSKEIDKMSDSELTDFLQYTEAGLNGEEKVTVAPENDVKELLEDIPVSELKEFIEETSDIETDEVLMN